MEDLKIGELIRRHRERDAIHMAIAPVEATCELKPGQVVDLSDDGKAIRQSSSYGVGIVDPFLSANVHAGDRFWLFLRPGTITSLRHDWSSPSFPSVATRNENPAAIDVLRSFATAIGFEYETTLDYLGQMADSGSVYGEFFYDEIPDSVWDAYEMVVGVKVYNRADSFSCTC